MSTILEVHALTGGYNRKSPVIRDLSFTVREKEIVALIGLNGAGKSTTIKHILGLMKPIEGKVTIYGSTLLDAPEMYRSHLAFIPETPDYYRELTLWEHLELTAMVRNLDQQTFLERSKSLLKKFQMEDKIHLFPEHFSKGMRQKLMIMMALLIEPKLLIVDEPLMGLDPLGIRSFLESMNEAKMKGSGILLSTHILSTAERYCDRFIILHKGKILTQGTLDELRSSIDQPNATLDELYIQYIEGMTEI